MLKKQLLYTLLCCTPWTFIQTKAHIRAICLDIETIFETNDMKASSYVGKIDSLRYLKTIGNLPCQKDLFSKLEKVPAQSNIFTYNDGLKMPLILSDWLTHEQSASACLSKILSYLTTSTLPDIQKKILGNIIKMMMHPDALVDTQKLIPSTEKLIEQLKQKGYKLYLTGNWAHLESLQKEFGRSLQNFSGIFVSGKIKLLKPHQTFYTAVLEKINIDSSEILWLEKEPNFISQMKKYNFHVIHYDPKDKKTIYKDLQSFGITL